MKGLNFNSCIHSQLPEMQKSQYVDCFIIFGSSFPANSYQEAQANLFDRAFALVEDDSKRGRRRSKDKLKWCQFVWLAFQQSKGTSKSF